MLSKKIYQKTFNLLIVIVLYFLFVSVFSKVVVSVYSFGGFTQVEEINHFYSLLALMLFALIIPLKINSTLDLFLILSYLFLLLPSAVLKSMQGSSEDSMMVIFFGVLLVVVVHGIVGKTIVRKLNTAQLKKINIPESNAKILIISVISVLLLLAITVGFRMSISFMDIYDYRFDINDRIKFPLNYLLPLAAGPVTAFLVGYYCDKRQFMPVTLIIILSILFFGFSSHKSFMFTPLLTVFVFLIINTKADLFKLMSLFLGLGCLIVLNVQGLFADLMGSTFANRVLFIPAHIHYAFMDEFKNLEFMFWSESRITLGLIESPLSIGSVNHIAEKMTGNSEIGANVGWIANGYMNLGVFGVLIYSLVISFLLILIDIMANKIGGAVIISSFAVPIFMLITSSDLLTLMLTGGVLPMLLILKVMMVKIKFIN